MWRTRITVVSVLFLFFSPAIVAQERRGQDEEIFVEMFLSLDHKSDLDTIRKVFATHSVHRVHAQFFRKGTPPRNIALGSRIPADIARLTIDLAIKYNRGITHLLPSFRFFPYQIAMGTSAFDETVPVSIRPEDLERLKDPALSTADFHKLYRQLTGEKH